MSLELHSITKRVGADTHIHETSLTLADGTFNVLLGTTLAGKTTLMQLMAGIQKPTSGTIHFKGRDVTGVPVQKRNVSMVYQQFINYSNFTVYDNIASPLRVAGMAPGEIEKRVGQAAELLRLTPMLERRPGELSGGQQQRTAIARAVVKDSDLILLDEPLANLDYKLREQMREELRGLFSDQGGSIVLYTTTEPNEAMTLGDVVLVMHEGRLVQMGPPDEVFDRPATAAVAGIVNDPAMNIVDGAIEDGVIRLDAAWSLPLAPHMRGLALGPFRFGMRAIELELGDSDDVVGTVTFSEVSGSETFIHVDTGFGPLVIQIKGVHAFPLGATVPVAIDQDKLFVFGPDDRLVAAP